MHRQALTPRSVTHVTGYERISKKYGPDVVLVEGDTNTVVAAGLAGTKLRVPLGHVEARATQSEETRNTPKTTRPASN